jgi:hypothetical protein
MQDTFTMHERDARAEIRAVLRRGSSVDVRDASNGNTLLHLAVEHNLLDETIRLIGAGARLTVKNNDGLTPRRLALHLGNQAILQVFTRRQAYARYKERLGEARRSFRNTSIGSAISSSLAASTHGSTVSSMEEDGIDILHTHDGNKKNSRHTVVWDVTPAIIYDDFMNWNEATHVTHLRALVTRIRQQETRVKVYYPTATATAVSPLPLTPHIHSVL